MLLQRLKAWRRHCGLTQEKFSEAAKLGLKYYQLVEQGHRVDLRLSTIQKFAKAFGVRVCELLDPDAAPPAPKAKKSSIRRTSSHS